MNDILESAAVLMNTEPTDRMADAYDVMAADAELFRRARGIMDALGPSDRETLAHATRRLAEFGEPDPARAEALCRVGMASVRRAAGMGAAA